VLLSVVVVLAGLFVAADRVALAIAEDKAASALQSSQHLSSKPDVSVPGFPFLTQLAAGSFDEITVSAKDIAVGRNRDIDLSRVDVDLHDVTVSNNYSSVHADSATASARITYDELSRALGTTVHAGDNGRLVAEPTVNLLGQSFHGTVSAVVHASSGAGITFGDPKVSVGGVQIPDAVSQALANVFQGAISLAGLPFGVRVTGVAATSSGLVLDLAGTNLTYSRS
jgi:hypothetical protein